MSSSTVDKLSKLFKIREEKAKLWVSIWMNKERCDPKGFNDQVHTSIFLDKFLSGLNLLSNDTEASLKICRCTPLYRNINHVEVVFVPRYYSE